MSESPLRNQSREQKIFSKLEIAQKECYKAAYWLELMYETGYIPTARYKMLQNTSGTIRRMLISSINTVKVKQ